MNLEQKVDAILTTVSNPTTSSGSSASVSDIVAALQPKFDAIAASLADIQGQIDEPTATPSPTPAPTPAPAS